jgi:hypothetical protein
LVVEWVGSGSGNGNGNGSGSGSGKVCGGHCELNPFLNIVNRSNQNSSTFHMEKTPLSKSKATLHDFPKTLPTLIQDNPRVISLDPRVID